MSYTHIYEAYRNGELAAKGLASEVAEEIGSTYMYVSVAGRAKKILHTKKGAFDIKMSDTLVRRKSIAKNTENRKYGELKKESFDERKARIEKQRKQLTKILKTAKNSNISYGYQVARQEGKI